jgi:transposase-like protein
MSEVTEALTGESPGRSAVSQVAKQLYQAVEGPRVRPLGAQPYLYLDVIHLDARQARFVETGTR